MPIPAYGHPTPSDYLVECVVRDIRNLHGKYYTKANLEAALRNAPNLEQIMEMQRNDGASPPTSSRADTEDQGLAREDQRGYEYCMKHNIWAIGESLKDLKGRELALGQFYDLRRRALNPELLCLARIGLERVEDAASLFTAQWLPVEIPDSGSRFAHLVVFEADAVFLHERAVLAATSLSVRELCSTYTHPVAKTRRHLATISDLTKFIEACGGLGGAAVPSVKEEVAKALVGLRKEWLKEHQGEDLPLIPERRSWSLAEAPDQPLFSLAPFSFSSGAFSLDGAPADPPNSRENRAGAAEPESMPRPFFHGVDEFLDAELGDF